MIPTVELRHFFGGYIGKFNLARKLAEQGRRKRLLTVDPTPPLPRGWRTRSSPMPGSRTLRRGRDRLRPRPRRAGCGQSRGRVRGDHLVDGARGERRDAGAGQGPVPVPDPGVRALHLSDGLVGGARDEQLRVPTRSDVLQRVAPRVLRRALLRCVQGRPRSRRNLAAPFRTRSLRCGSPRSRDGGESRRRCSSMHAPRAMAPATCSNSAFSASPSDRTGHVDGSWELHRHRRGRRRDRIQIGPAATSSCCKRSDQEASRIAPP